MQLQDWEDLLRRVQVLARTDEKLLVELRRQLHSHPELSGQEGATTDLVEAQLRAVGLSPTRLAVGTGLVCDLHCGAGTEAALSSVIALRADLDALAMHDDKEVAYRSRNVGVAHACGHDVHTAILVGAARVLAELGPALDLTGTVRFIFEPSEESVPGGAVDVIAEGWLHDVTAIFGLHCDPKLDVGQVGCRTGAITSAADLIEVQLRGPGGHTARPGLTVDLVRVMAALVVDLQGIIDELTENPGDLVIVFGAIHAGDAANVIPAQGSMRGTLRTRDHATWVQAPELFEQAVQLALGATDALWEVHHRRGVPPVINDRAATELLADAARESLGPDAVMATDQSMGGDSFAWYLEKIPGSYARLGVHNPASGMSRLDLHASTFDVDERAIHAGVLVLVTTALRALASLPSSY